MDRMMNCDLRKVLQMGGENLVNSLNPQNSYMPYWKLEKTGPDTAQFLEMWPQHNIGRWWDAVLRLEEAIGFTLPPHAEEQLLETTRVFFDNPDSLCLTPDQYKNDFYAPFELHSLRESLLALNALAKYRNDPWAAQKGHEFLTTIERIYEEDGSWELTRLKAPEKTFDIHERGQDPTGSHGRMLQAVIWFYQTTGDPLALTVAQKIAEYHFNYSTLPDGSINHACKADHAHSYFNTLLGLILYGQMTGQRKYIDRVVSLYENAVRSLITESGFVAHDLGTDGTGETGSAGDVVQIALWLADEGYTNYYEDAERIIRARLFPAQVTGPRGLQPSEPDLSKDCFADVDTRGIGAFMDITDITSANVHALTDAYRHIAVDRSGCQYILLHFSYENDTIALHCERHDTAVLNIELKRDTALCVRIPTWTDSVRCTVNGQPSEFEKNDMFADFGALTAGTVIQLTHTLPEKETIEKMEGKLFHFFWKGDCVTGVDPQWVWYPGHK